MRTHANCIQLDKTENAENFQGKETNQIDQDGCIGHPLNLSTTYWVRRVADITVMGGSPTSSVVSAAAGIAAIQGVKSFHKESYCTYWNQILTCCSDSWRDSARLSLSHTERYLVVLNLFSSETSCSYVKAVRALLDFPCFDDALVPLLSFVADGSELSVLRLGFFPEDFCTTSPDESLLISFCFFISRSISFSENIYRKSDPQVKCCKKFWNYLHVNFGFSFDSERRILLSFYQGSAVRQKRTFWSIMACLSSESL